MTQPLIIQGTLHGEHLRAELKNGGVVFITRLKRYALGDDDKFIERTHFSMTRLQVLALFKRIQALEKDSG